MMSAILVRRMKRQIVLLVFMAFAAIVTSSLMCQQSNQCDAGWTYFDGKCYFYGHKRGPFSYAQLNCECMNAVLAEIHSEEENIFLKSMAEENGANAIWVGATDSDEEGTWIWLTTGQSFDQNAISDWAPNEPNNDGGNEDCLCLYVRLGYQWNDCNCNAHENYICETSAQER